MNRDIHPIFNGANASQTLFIIMRNFSSSIFDVWKIVIPVSALFVIFGHVLNVPLVEEVWIPLWQKFGFSIQSGYMIMNFMKRLKDEVKIDLPLLRDAAANGKLDIVKLVMNKLGAADQETLHNAVLNEHLDIIKYLVESSISISKTLIYEAIDNSVKTDIVKYLMKNYLIQNASRFSKDHSFLHYVTQHSNDMELMEYILESNFDKEELTKAFSIAIIHDNLNFAEKILQKGADINAVSIANKLLPAVIVKGENNFKKVKFLIQHGMSFNKEDDIFSPILLSNDHDNTSILSLISCECWQIGQQ